MLKVRNKNGTRILIHNGDFIGGRNYFRNTATMPYGSIADKKYSAYVNQNDFLDTGEGIKITYRDGASEGMSVPIVFDDCIKDGDIVTLSFEYRGNITKFGQLYWIQKSGDNFFTTLTEPMIVSDTTWQKYRVTFTAQYVNTRINCYVLLCYQNLDSSKWVEIKKGTLKLEKGPISTDWTPAPEDYS